MMPDLIGEKAERWLRRSSVIRFVRRGQHAVVYHAIVRPAIKRTDVTSMLDLTLTVPPTVFHPRFYVTSRFFAEHIRTMELAGKEVLEMGCGSGILSLVAARRGADVTALDINPLAVECTAFNAMANHVQDRIRALQSDLFENLAAGTAFDYIVWSPPFYPKETTDNASYAWNAGIGFEVISRFARAAGEYLRAGGTIVLLLSSETDVPVFLSIFASNGFTATRRALKRKLFETLSIYEFSPRAPR